jgi:hypothetical protein
MWEYHPIKLAHQLVIALCVRVLPLPTRTGSPNTTSYQCLTTNSYVPAHATVETLQNATPWVSCLEPEKAI